MFARTVNRSAFRMHCSKRPIFPHSSVQRVWSALHWRSFPKSLAQS